MKKRSLSLVLTVVMLLALACGAWAATTPGPYVSQDVFAKVQATQGGIIVVDGISIDVTDDLGMQAYDGGSLISGSADVTTKASGTGTGYHGIVAQAASSKIQLVGSIKTSANSSHGAVAHSTGIIDFTGDISTTGEASHGVNAYSSGSLDMVGNITASGAKSSGAHSQLNSSVNIVGNITTSGPEATSAFAYDNSVLWVRGDVTATGTDSFGLRSAFAHSIINMSDGTLTITDVSSFAVRVENDSEVNLTEVTVDAANLLLSATSGTLTATSSDLTGDVLHSGIGGTAGTLGVNLEDSTLEGAILASTGIGTLSGGPIDLTLDDSTWIVTGDSNTNGAVISSGDSVLDTTLAPDGTLVAIDEIVGLIDINVKPGDTLQVDNADGNNSFSSSDPDVIEVTQNANGSWTIVSKSEGPADLTYTYKDEFGATQTVTSTVTSGSGVKPAGNGGGGSSGCNAGFGVLALLGLAFVYKKK